MGKDLKEVKLEDIEIGDIALRGAELENDQFKGLMKSIEINGVLQSIVVQPSPDTPGKYRLIDGLQRVTIMHMLGKTTIPATIIDADEAQVMKVQVQTNLHRVNTKPAAYGKQLLRWMALDPTLTTVKMAEELGVSVQWITQRINLRKLRPEIAERVDSGEINASNAFALAKLPPEEQPDWVKRAMTQPSDTFVEACLARAKDIREQARAGKQKTEEVFSPVQRLRKIADIKLEFENGEAGATLVTQDMTAIDGFKAAIEWVLHQDAPTLQADREKWEADKAARDEKKRKREEEREAKKAAKEAEKAAKAEAAETEMAETRAAVTQE